MQIINVNAIGSSTNNIVKKPIRALYFLDLMATISEYNSKFHVILEGLNAIEMFHDLVVDKDLNDKLPLFNKVYSFFHNNEKELEFKFDEISQ